MTRKSHHRCPVCREPLSLARPGDYRSGFFVWCANGPCKSVAANEGAEAASEKQAFKQLKARIQEELLD